MKKTLLSILLTISLGVIAAPIVSNGEKISFLGDSITGLGIYNETGYVNLVIDGLKSVGVEAVRMPAGKGGDTSGTMLVRLQRDVLNYQPQFMTLSCGINDVWHSLKKQGVELPEYKKNMRQIVLTAKKAGVKVLILTPTMIYEDPDNELNTKLESYNEFLRKLAAEEKCILVDTNGAVKKEFSRMKQLYPHVKGNILTIDGVHLNPLGDVAMAKEILRGFGLTEAEITAAESHWGNRIFYSGMCKIRLKDFKKIVSAAEKNSSSIADALNFILQDALDNYQL